MEVEPQNRKEAPKRKKIKTKERKEMANANSKNAVLTNLAVIVFALLVIASVAESRMMLGIFKKSSTPQCYSVYGVSSGDTCFAVEQFFNLTTEFFDSINPNLNCDKLFPGQWLCISGTT